MVQGGNFKMAEMIEQKAEILKAEKPARFSFNLFKKTATKIGLGIVGLGLLVGGVFIFRGCQIEPGLPGPETSSVTSTTYTPSTTSPSTTTPNTTVAPPTTTAPVEKISLEEFVTTYQEQAIEFAYDYFIVHNTPDRQRLTFTFTVNREGKINGIISQCIKTGEGNQRQYLEEKYEIYKPLDINYILDGNFKIEDIDANYFVKEILTYDAKQNYFKADLKDALMQACEIEKGLCFFTEIDSKSIYKRAYHVLHTDENNKITVYEVKTELSENPETQIQYILSHPETEIKTYNYNGFENYPDYDPKTSVPAGNYKEETFLPENAQDIIENFPDDLHKILNEHFYGPINLECYGEFYNENKLIKSRWNLIEENNQIVGIRYTSYYEVSELFGSYRITNVNFNNPIEPSSFIAENADDIFADAVQNCTIHTDFAAVYNPSDIGNRELLINEMCDSHGLNKWPTEEESRYIYPDYMIIDHDTLGTVKKFTILQISEDKAIKFDFYVKECSTDEEYIQQIKLGNCYDENEVIYELFDDNGIDYKDIEAESMLDEETEL